MKRDTLYEVKGPKNLEEMSATELAEALKTADIAVLSFGAIENHSGHLPLGADNYQGRELIKRTAMCLTERGLPAVPGYCIPFGVRTNRFERLSPMGDIAISQDTFIRLVEDFALSLIETGFKRLVFCVSHAENHASLHVAAKDLGDKYNVPVILADWIPSMRSEWPKFLKNPTHQGHGGEDETSCVMAVVPNLVDLSDVGSYHPPEDKNPIPCDDLSYYGGAVGIYVPLAEDKSKGYIGDPGDATVECGEICYDKYAAWIADIVCKYWGASVHEK